MAQRGRILWHSGELWEWGQHCWKSCSRAFTGSLQPGMESWRLHVDLPGPAWACRVAQNRSLRRELCWGWIPQADPGALGGDVWDWTFVELGAAGRWLSFISHWWHWQADTSPSHGMESRGTGPPCLQAWQAARAGLEGQLLGDCVLWFYSQSHSSRSMSQAQLGCTRS